MVLKIRKLQILTVVRLEKAGILAQRGTLKEILEMRKSGRLLNWEYSEYQELLYYQL